MLELVTAVRFDRRMNSGRTKPCALACSGDGAGDVEVIGKLSAFCDRGVDSLAAEAIAAMLGTELGLPVPAHYVVQLTPEFVDTIPDAEIAKGARDSCSSIFGSKRLPPGFITWPSNQKVPQASLQLAAEVFAFDALIENVDRTRGNPNCLFKGTDIAIYDHDLAFPHYLPLIGKKWPKPWVMGGLERWAQPDSHLFSDSLRGKKPQLGRLQRAWSGISNQRLAEYGAALPKEWCKACVAPALSLIADIRDNIVPALAEVSRVLE